MKKQYILLLLAITTTLSLTACGNTSQSASTGVSTEVVLDNTEVDIETEVTEVVVENTELEITETEAVEETEVTVIGEEVNESSRPDLENYFQTHEFVGFNENYKCVKGDPRYEIIDGCYKGVPLKGSTSAESWEDMVVWISPAGVEIKINDMYSYLATKKDIIGREDAIWTKDPDKNLEPGSEWMVESSKFAYGESDEKVFRQAHGSVDLSTLPNVSTATEKRSSFNLTDEFLDYVEQWSIYSNFKAFGTLEYNIVNALLVQDDHAYVWLEGMTKIWDIKREDDYWKITIFRNLNDLDWHGLKTCLKNVEPDAELVYDAIYNEFYHDTGIPENDTWVDFNSFSIRVYLENGAICFDFK